MDRNTFLNAVLDDGIYEITTSYNRPDQKMKREGGIAGFEACRGKEDHVLLTLFTEAQRRTRDAASTRDPQYWWHRTHELQIEWVLNVLSARLYLSGNDVLVPTTARGVLKANNILSS